MNANDDSIILTSRFRTATHALVWLAMNQCVQSSASLAGQVHSHAAFLRRVILPFVQAGLVEAREGRDGGYMLKVSPESVTLADIFVIVHSDTISDSDHSDCGEVGIQLDKALEEMADAAEQQLIATLQQFTLADLLNRMN